MQYSGVQGFKTVLQYSLLGSSVLQYIALYCGWKDCRRPGCIAIQPGASWHETGLPVSQDRQLCRDKALGARLGAWGAQAGAPGERHGLGARRAGEHAGGRIAGRGRRRRTRRHGRARQERGRGVRGTRPRLGARAGQRLCTRCTRPVFILV